jgi:predicted Zn-dependent peptidase
MYGDHSVGWEMAPSDLEPEDLTEDRLRWVHRRVVCPENLILGVTGDVTWERIRPLTCCAMLSLSSGMLHLRTLRPSPVAASAKKNRPGSAPVKCQTKSVYSSTGLPA